MSAAKKSREAKTGQQEAREWPPGMVPRGGASPSGHARDYQRVRGVGTRNTTKMVGRGEGSPAELPGVRIDTDWSGCRQGRVPYPLHDHQPPPPTLAPSTESNSSLNRIF
ncbi:hypothetical protein AAG570_006525 [Ranatra chinensis]|uniref:Uncharacterized protein n=1 Tax=Ranatra chinensis TaxID=642074 RepID=A0ABD0Z4U0_9HEMI